MVLILSDTHDSHVNYAVTKIDFEYFRLDLDVSALRETSILFHENKWTIKRGDNRIDSDDISCVWARRNFVELLLEEENDQSPDFKIWKNEWNRALLGFYLSINKKPWLNPIREAYLAENKYLQMQIAKELALLMPDIIVSNIKDDLIHFATKYDFVALKLMEQSFYQTEDGLKGFYVNKIQANHLQNFGTSFENPIVLQEYKEKKFEVRYTVVGNTHFVCKIDSQRNEKTQTDWRRYNIPQTPHNIIQPPQEIKEKVQQLMQRLSLTYGALDFIVTPNDEWYFLEINSMGQYLWIEDLTGLEITNEILNWLRLNNNHKF